jgi:hypothetical protein
MAKVGFYVSDEEREWIKSQGPGWLRGMVKEAMGEAEGRQAMFTGVPLEVLEQEAKLLPLGGDKPSAILQAMGVQRGVEGVWNGHCPDCGEKLNRKGQPHGCKGRP